MSIRRGPRSTADRLRGLLVMLPWLAERGRVRIDEMASQFDLSVEELVGDLTLAAMCGLPPFQDELIDVYFDDDDVCCDVPRVFTRPLQLTAIEGFQVLVSARMAMQVPGADRGGALGRALDKLRTVLGDDGVVVDDEPPPATAALTEAIRRCERVHIGYWTRGESRGERDITPYALFTDRGNWYVKADDHQSGEERVFRVDRIDLCERTGIYDDPREVDVPESDEWFLDEDHPVATIEVDRTGGWVVERYPFRRAEPLGDGWRIDLTVATREWLAELMLRLGPTARVVSPPDLADVGTEAARRLLEVYDAGGSDAS
ncbi:MAG: helix-turn-helix transcriptional regulator [Ilumatobacteraceae bacterium]